MLLLTSASIGLLALLNYRFSKSLFHPAVIFCAFWAFDLLVLWAADYLFYRIHPVSLVVFLFGGAMFSFGSFLASLKTPKKLQAVSSAATNRLITISVWIIVLSVPIYVRWILSLVADRGATVTFLMAARIGLLDVQGTGIVATLFGAIILGSIVVALVAFREREGHEKRSLIAIAAAMIICVLTATKAAPVWLVLGLLFLHWLKTGRLKLKVIAIAMFVFSVVIFSVEFFVHINGNSFKESAVPVLENVAIYVSGGIVDFDQIVENPTVIPPIPNPIYDTLKKIAKRFFGANLEVSPAIPDFVFIGPHDFRGNTYSVYSSWLVFGLAGSVLMMVPIGYFLTTIYSRARAGGACSSILYALFISGLAFSPLTDYLASLAMIVVFSGGAWFFFYMPGRFNQFTAFVHRILLPDRASPA